MIPILEAVPNFSEGRDPDFLDEVVRVAARSGVDVLDRSMDPDHHRSVVTVLGDPASVQDAAVEMAKVAMECIDLREHRGVHPRIGALDVLPFVPLHGCTMADAVAVAHRVGERLSRHGLPVYFYGQASDPPGRRLGELRRGGVESLMAGYPPGREPDLDGGRQGPHPGAGVTCVGARPLLLAWNVWVEGVEMEDLRALARELRETGGGFPGLRALALRLPRQGAAQISMNLEEVERGGGMAVMEAIEERVASAGGRIGRTEVIGLIPETLVLEAAASRLRLLDPSPDRLVSMGVARHLARRAGSDLEALLSWLERQEVEMPDEIRRMTRRLAGHPSHEPSPGERE